jgi:hypothetical protein
MIRLLSVGLVCVAALGCGGIIDGGGNGSDGGSNGRADGYAGADAALCTLSTDCGTRCVQGCVANSCPGDGTCILFFPRGSYKQEAALPGLVLHRHLRDALGLRRRLRVREPPVRAVERRGDDPGRSPG